MSCTRTLKDKTTTPLVASGVYVGSPIKTELYNQIRGIVNADQNGTLDFEESEDGETWFKTATQTVNANTPLAFAFDCHAYYARVKYTNGATAQTSFNLQVYADPF